MPAAGTFSNTPLGVILHGTRSGSTTNSTHQEYVGTVNFYNAGAGDLGWNVTIGDGERTEHFSPRWWGWNAREHSSVYLAVEFAQPQLGSPITNGQVEQFADWFVFVARRMWVNLPLNFPEHWELPAGKRDGKSDCDPAHPGVLANRCRAAINALLEPTEDNTVKIPQAYVDKFNLGDDQNIQGLIDNFEGVVREARRQGVISAVVTLRKALDQVRVDADQ